MKLIILDRDGVINYDSDNYIKSVDEFIPLPRSLEAIARLNQAGYTVVVATNQSGIARGYYNENTLTQMHAKLSSLLSEVGGEIAAIYHCPHGPDDHCDCRKPKAGLLKQIFADYPAQASQTPVIGDSLRDLQAALAVGAEPILVKTGKGERTLPKLADEPSLKHVPIYDDLFSAVEALLKQSEESSR